MAEEMVGVARDSARGGFFLVSGATISTVILAISSIVIARYLGPDLYGQYTLAFVVPTLIFLFADLGIDQGIIKFTASLRVKGDSASQAKIIQHGLLLRAAIGVVIFITSYVLADPFATFIIRRPDLVFYMRIGSIAVLLQTLFTTSTNAFVGLDKSEYSALTTNIQAVAKTIIQIILVLLGFSVVGALIGHLAGYVLAVGIGLCILLFSLRRKQDPQKGHPFLEDVKTLVHYGAPLYVSTILIGFVPAYQNLMVGIFASNAEIGNFRAAANFVTLITVITAPIATTLLPAFSKLDSAANTKIRTFFKLANKYTTILVLPVMMLLVIFSSEIVQIVYGSTFQSAPIFLATYCLLYLLVGLGSLTLVSFYNGLGETRTTLKINLIIFIVFVLLGPLLTSVYSVVGLIEAFLIANVAGTTYAAYTAIRKFKIDFGARLIVKIYFVSITSSIPTLILLRFLSMPNFLSLVVGGLLYLSFYATLIPFTRIIENGELRAITQTLQKVRLLNHLIKPLLKYEQKILEYREAVKYRSV